MPPCPKCDQGRTEEAAKPGALLLWLHGLSRAGRMAVKQYLVGDQDLLSRGLNSACLTILLQIFSALQLPPTADHGVLSFFSQGKCTHLKGFSSPHISRAACFTSTKQILVADPARPHKRTAWHKLNASPGTSFQHLPKHLSPLDESSVQQLLVGTLQER